VDVEGTWFRKSTTKTESWDEGGGEVLRMEIIGENDNRVRE
jgi:hypothetical protein